MRTKTRIKLLVLLIVCMTTALIAGCSVGEDTLDKYLQSHGAQGQCVTYYGNGGTFNGNVTKTQVDVYYTPDSYIICSDQEKFYVKRDFYNFDAWYYAELSGGEPVFDSEGNLKLSSKKVVETDTLPEGAHYYVGAKWNANVAIDVYLVTDGFTVKTSGGEYKSGDKIKTSNFGSATVYGLSDKRDAVTATNATFLSFYADEDCTKPIVTVNKPEDVNAENVKVYAKYLEGKWTVVKNASGENSVLSMFNGMANGEKYYLFTPDGSNEIDCTGVPLTISSYSFNSIVEGNGVTLKNLTLSADGMNGSYSIFGKLTSAAKISNLTLKDVTITAKAKSEIDMYLVMHGDEGADISGLTVENVTLTISTPDTVGNIQNGNTDSWLFGGYETDDKFLNEKGGITVINATLIINGEKLADNISKNQEE